MHILINGMTESGKTTAAKLLIQKFRKQGVKSIVLDPLKDPAFNADYQTNNQEEFLKMVYSSRQCLIIIDESGEAVGRYSDTMNKLATMGRHWGHTVVFICQKGTQLSPLVREQCSAVFLFACGRKTRELLIEDFNCPELNEAGNLAKGDYFYKSKFGELKRGNIFKDWEKEKQTVCQ